MVFPFLSNQLQARGGFPFIDDMIEELCIVKGMLDPSEAVRMAWVESGSHLPSLQRDALNSLLQDGWFQEVDVGEPEIQMMLDSNDFRAALYMLNIFIPALRVMKYGRGILNDMTEDNNQDSNQDNGNQENNQNNQDGNSPS